MEDKSWYNDRGFWERYLNLLAAQRFNRFHLAFGIGYDFVSDLRDCYFHFAYPFLVSPAGEIVARFRPTVTPEDPQVTDAIERVLR